MNTVALTRFQWRIVVLGWITYAAFYLGRVNLATALPAIQTDLRLSPDQTSILAGAMLWAYAFGQLINGWLGGRVDTRRMVLIGILGSTLINLLFALSSSLPMMVGLWLVNGFFQSMGWGPVLRTLSDTLSTPQRHRIAGLFGASYVIGNTATWVLTALLLHTGQWRLIFVIPSLLMMGIGLIFYRLSVSAKPSTDTHIAFNVGLAKSILRQFWYVLVTALIAGALINGALIYAPTYMAQTLPLDEAALTAIVFPVFGLLGTAWLSDFVMHRFSGNTTYSLAVLLILAALSRAIVFILPSSTLTAMILLASMGITSYALTNILLTAVPLTTSSNLGASVVAGTIDATHSIGGAIGNTVVGLLLTQGGWSLVFGVWTFLPLIALGFFSIVIQPQWFHRVGRKEEI